MDEPGGMSTETAQQRYRRLHPGRVAASQAAYKAKNRKKLAAYDVAYKAKNRKRIHRQALNRKYGLTPEGYDCLLSLQNHACGCCGRTDPGRSNSTHFMVDHDHKTGQVRGLLCYPCNSAIGKLGDSIEGLQRALNYLTNAETKTQQLLDQHSAEA
jgi:hypothetical protein